MNQVILVGRLADDPIIKKAENGKSYTSINLVVSRPFKNMDGIYENDYIRCVLWNGMASNTYEYCHKNDVIAIKGRLQQKDGEDSPVIIAEKVSFLASRKEENEHISNN